MDYRRGRGGRPLNRAKALLKTEGSNVCWICGAPIDLVLSARDPNHAMAWTLDHAIPLSIRPDLSLEPSNHREAHRKCNSSKGNRVRKIARNASRAW
ncbi:HNH endonuclease [Streptomyces sp. SID3212]|uniref:HNH endonuclease n=1 Tax=Streptomyces sp. SID3212 TaxID=2690259 RepID=UPI001371CE6E|nr:HNH endonuclease [Streptomyces sp. SID3212]MYV58031.1 HNH endonuclease [Streptomyces sp. SID3212]